MSSIPYYWVNPKNNRAYWKPNQRMRALGFGCVSLGEAGPDAEASAREWTARWKAARTEEVHALGIRFAPRIRDPQFVYFLRVDDRIKIGTSRKPLVRLQDIVAFLPGRLRAVIVVAGTREDELRLHDRFRAYRTNGEWFAASRPLVLTITRSAAAGQVIHDGLERTDPEDGVESFENRSRIARRGRKLCA